MEGSMAKTISAVAVLLLLAGAAATVAWDPAPEFIGPIYDGGELDYQPSIILVQPEGRLMVVFERLRLADYFGDLYVTFSDDGGLTWSTPGLVLDSPLNERHPSLLQLDENSFVLFYLVDETGGGSYRIHRATSPDGVTWTSRGAIELGWETPGEINPNAIKDADGTLTMTYHRLPYPGYSHIAQSHDGGVTWDTLKTPVSDGDANLPRLAKRESDGLYMVSYQVGGSDLDLFAKLSYDPYDWSGPQNPVSTDVNTHDSQPIVLEDGTFLVTYAKTPVNYFDLFYRLTYDGITWSDEAQITYDYLHYDTQPHPLRHGIPGHVILTWSHQDSVSPYQDHDVWIDIDLLVSPSLLGAGKSVSPAVFAPELMPLTYTLSVPNTGLTTTATLVDPLPPKVDYVPDSLWASNGSYGYDSARGIITWTGTISTDAAVTVTFQVTPTSDLADAEILTNTAWLTAGLAVGRPLEAVALADALPPVSLILVPHDGQIISDTSILISGVASDTVSGVAAVGVSVDGGPWEGAEGQESWTYQWQASTESLHNLRSRAVDLVGHVENPGPGITVTVDTIPPVLLATSPVSGAVDIPLSAAVVLTFSEPIVTGTLVYGCSPDPGGWSITWAAGDTVATLSHEAMSPGQIYTFWVSQARDRAFNPIVPVAWSFTTGSGQEAGWIHLPVVLNGYP
jgi:uncharacterized repeat protein (TIGR01451 family)